MATGRGPGACTGDAQLGDALLHDVRCDGQVVGMALKEVAGPVDDVGDVVADQGVGLGRVGAIDLAHDAVLEHVEKSRVLEEPELAATEARVGYLRILLRVVKLRGLERNLRAGQVREDRRDAQPRELAHELHAVSEPRASA